MISIKIFKRGGWEEEAYRSHLNEGEGHEGTVYERLMEQNIRSDTAKKKIERGGERKGERIKDEKLERKAESYPSANYVGPVCQQP